MVAFFEKQVGSNNKKGKGLGKTEKSYFMTKVITYSEMRGEEEETKLKGSTFSRPSKTQQDKLLRRSSKY